MEGFDVELSIDEIEFFKDNGYLIKRSVLDPKLMARARDRLWDGAPPSMKRDDQASWVGPIRPEEESEDPSNRRKGFRWQFREPGGEPFMLRLLATDPNVFGFAEQLIGKHQLQKPVRIRGIYCTLPYGKKNPGSGAGGCHVDAHPFHLGVVGYIDDVGPGGGGFTVWSGSHRTFFGDFRTRYTFNPNKNYQGDREKVLKQSSVECHGRAGDVVFWHHRIGHTAPPNRTGRIRQAVLYDFRKVDLAEYQDRRPTKNMWYDWSEELRRV